MSISNFLSNAWLVTAILNGLGSLIRHRPSISNRILSSIFNYNPFASFDRSLTPRSKLLMKSIEKTLRALLLNVIKKWDPAKRHQVHKLSSSAEIPAIHWPVVFNSTLSVFSSGELRTQMIQAVRDLPTLMLEMKRNLRSVSGLKMVFKLPWICHILSRNYQCLYHNFILWRMTKDAKTLMSRQYQSIL